MSDGKKSNRMRLGVGWILGIVVALGVSGLEAKEPKEPLTVGESLPAEARSLEMATPSGESAKLESLMAEEGLLVVFTSNTCPYSTDWRDRLPQLGDQGDRLKVGLAIVNANERKRKSDDSPEAMAAQAEAHFEGRKYWIDAESRLADLLGAARTPEAFLFDGEGKLIYHGQIDDHSGPQEKVTHHFLRDAMDAMVNGEEVPATTAPLGCSILRPRKRRPRPKS